MSTPLLQVQGLHAGYGKAEVLRGITLDVPARELAKRRKALKLRPPVKTRGVLAKYADHVSQAHLGAITDGSLEE